MRPLNTYGKILRKYEGSGELVVEQGLTFACNFEIAQLANGHIAANFEVTQLQGKGMGFGRDIMPCILRGTTNEGWSLTAKGDFIFELQLGWDQSEGSYFRLSSPAAISEVIASSPEKVEGQNRLVHFGLTNCEFVGDTIPLNIDSTVLTIRKLSNYKEIIESLRANPATDVTAEAIVELSAGPDAGSIGDMIDNLHSLLSLAAGTYITWLYSDTYLADGTLAASLHRGDVSTAPFVTQRLIHKGKAGMKRFLEVSYPNYKKYNQQYMLARAIDACLQSKLYPLAETKFSMAAMALEVLNSRFAVTYGWEYIPISSNQFQRIKRQLKGHINSLLEELSEKLSDEGKARIVIDSMVQKLPELRRPPFKQQLRLLCDEIGLVLSEDDLTWTSVRHDVIHKGSFDGRSFEEWYPEYRKLLNLTERILLKILGYRGLYLDCRNDYQTTQLD
jgi:hypothetical protein